MNKQLISIALCTLINPLYVIPMDKAAIVHSRTSSATSEGSTLLKKYVAECAADAMEDSRESVDEKLAALAQQQAHDPVLKKIVRQTGFTPSQIETNAKRWDKKFKKLTNEHFNQTQSYNLLSKLCGRILCAGFGLHAGYFLKIYPERYEREFFGAGIGITALGIVGLSYARYQRHILNSNAPTKQQAIALIAQEDEQKPKDNM